MTTIHKNGHTLNSTMSTRVKVLHHNAAPAANSFDLVKL